MKKNEQVLEAWLQMTTVINNERITSDLPYNESDDFVVIYIKIKMKM